MTSWYSIRDIIIMCTYKLPFGWNNRDKWIFRIAITNLRMWSDSVQISYRIVHFKSTNFDIPISLQSIKIISTKPLSFLMSQNSYENSIMNKYRNNEHQYGQVSCILSFWAILGRWCASWDMNRIQFRKGLYSWRWIFVSAKPSLVLSNT